MHKYYRIPLLFFFLAALIGLLLRFQFIAPVPGVRYTYFLHGHSHVMFLGWIFNVLYLAFVEYHLPQEKRGGFIKFFIALQVLVVAMMISFPLQGYGLYSIIFTTLHTLAVVGFIVVFYRRTRGQRSVSLWFTKVALFFFLLSTAGPFSLAYLTSHGLANTSWYNFSIYYYLHFQYNGFFLFGVISLFFQLMERKHIAVDAHRALPFGRVMAAACVLTYTLSVLFAAPRAVFNAIGAVGALLQLWGLWMLVRLLKPLTAVIRSKFTHTGYALLHIVALAGVLKLLLQVASAEPHIAQFAYQLRPVIIAYLHLTLIGVITLSVFVWMLERRMVPERSARRSMIVFLIGFIGSQFSMVLAPWWNRAAGSTLPSTVSIFGFSVLLVVGIFLFGWAMVKDQVDKSQLLM